MCDRIAYGECIGFLTPRQQPSSQEALRTLCVVAVPLRLTDFAPQHIYGENRDDARFDPYTPSLLKLA
jgi:hypothetical protein